MGYDLDDWRQYNRFSFNDVISTRDIVETMLPAWQRAIQDAGMSGFMCSYNSINGQPMCAGGEWINRVARDKWGMQGWVVSDCYAIEFLLDSQQGHGFTHNASDTVRAAMRGGCDIPCGPYFQLHAMDALTNNSITVADIDQVLMRQTTTLIRLGWFDPPAHQPYRQYNASRVSSSEHQALAKRATVEALVLLKNDNATLPLSNVASIGQSAGRPTHTTMSAQLCH